LARALKRRAFAVRQPGDEAPVVMELFIFVLVKRP
jgi:hypothetical protein